MDAGVSERGWEADWRGGWRDGWRCDWEGGWEHSWQGGWWADWEHSWQCNWEHSWQCGWQGDWERGWRDTSWRGNWQGGWREGDYQHLLQRREDVHRRRQAADRGERLLRQELADLQERELALREQLELLKEFSGLLRAEVRGIDDQQWRILEDERALRRVMPLPSLEFELLLLDEGVDSEVARRACLVLGAAGWTLDMISSTDRVGGAVRLCIADTPDASLVPGCAHWALDFVGMHAATEPDAVCICRARRLLCDGESVLRWRGRQQPCDDLASLFESTCWASRIVFELRVLGAVRDVQSGEAEGQLLRSGAEVLRLEGDAYSCHRDRAKLTAVWVGAR